MERIIFGILIMTSLLISSNVHASMIFNVDGTDYRVTTMTDTFTNLNTMMELENQVWWDNQDLANEFAETVLDAFGTPNFGEDGPYFAWRFVDDNGETRVRVATCFILATTAPNCDTSVELDNNIESEFTYAKATVVPIPAAAWLFMSGLLGLVYKGRKARQAAA